MHGFGDQDVSHRVLFAERAGETRSDAELIGLSQEGFGNPPRVSHTHAGDDDVCLSAAKLRLVRANSADRDFAQIWQAAPRSEFGFDRECD
jgi:hypothetical protein